MTASVRTAPLPLLVAALLTLGLVGSALAFLAWPAHAQSNDPPDEPTGLGASVVSGVGVNLTWNDPADDTITGYEILRRDLAVDRPGVFHTIESNTGSADTAYTDATVVAGGEYVYRVKAINPHGSSVWSSYARADVPDDYEAPGSEPATDPPARPTGLQASIESGVGVNLTWNDPADQSITGYVILRRDLAVHDSGELETIESDTGSSDTAYTDATVEAGHDYRYRVKAINAHGSSVWSRNAPADVPDDYEAPGSEPDPADLAPSNLTASLVDGGVSLTWDPPAEQTDSITGYAILRAVGEAELTVLVADTDSKATSYTDATATEKGSTYAYQVKALRGEEESEASNRAEAQVPHDPADLAPSGLTAALVDDGVSLSWEPPAEETASVSGYRVYRDWAQAGEGGITHLHSALLDTGSTTTSYTDTTPTKAGVTYSYRVMALRGEEQSQASNTAVVQVPHDPADLAPSGLTAALVDDGGVSLTWDAPAEETGSITGYAILRAQGEAELTVLVADTSGTATAYTDATAAEPGATYAYQVKALRGEEESQASNRAQAQVPRDSSDPTGLAVDLYTAGVWLTWVAPADDAEAVTGYEVQRSWTDDESVDHNDLIKLDGTDTDWVDTATLQTGVVYGYRVRAMRGEQTSGWSNEARVEYSVPSINNYGDLVVVSETAFWVEPVFLPQPQLGNTSVDICGRSWLAREAILEATPAADSCDAVSAEAMAALTVLDLSDAYDRSQPPNLFTVHLKADDFAGLEGLVTLDASSTGIRGRLPEGLFADLSALTLLRLKDNNLWPRLDAGVFQGLEGLTELDVRGYANEVWDRCADGTPLTRTGRGPEQWSCDDHGGVAAWNPRFGSPIAFAPLTGLVTYNWDAAAAYGTNNYSQPPPAPTGVDHWVSKIPGAGTDAVTVTLDWDAPTGAGSADVVGYRVGITRPGQIFGLPHDLYFHPSGDGGTNSSYLENFGRHSDLRVLLGADAGGYVDGTERDLRPGRTISPVNHRIGDTLQYWISALTADGNESIPVQVLVNLTTVGTEVWSADLTVGQVSSFSVGFSASDNAGTLSETTFSFKGTEYTIDQVFANTAPVLVVSFSGHGLGDEASNLVLQVGQEPPFDFGEATYASDTLSYTWDQNIPSWSVNDPVALRILTKASTDTVQASERPAPPTGVTATTYEGGFWRVEWDRTDDHTVTGYEIGYRGSPDMPWESYLADVGHVTDFDYHDLLPSFPGDPSRKPLRPCGGEQCVHTDYRNFRVRALSSAGASVWHYQAHAVRNTAKTIDIGAEGNTIMQGMHGHDGTLYVTDSFDRHLYAYDLSTGQRDETKEITGIGYGPWGVWSNDETIWISNPGGRSIQAFDLATKTLDTSKDITVDALPGRIWSDGQTMWAIHLDNSFGFTGVIGAYKLDQADFGTRDPDKDLRIGTGIQPRDLWSNGDVLLVVHRPSGDGGEIHAFDLATGAPLPQGIVPVDTNQRMQGIWSDGDTLWIGNDKNDEVWAYDLPLGIPDVGQWPFAGRRVYERDLALYSSSQRRRSEGLWSDGAKFWVPTTDIHNTGTKRRNIRLRTLDNPIDSSNPSLTDTEITLHSDNSNPRGNWSNGQIMFVADRFDAKIYAYVIEAGDHYGARIAKHDITLASDNNDSKKGITSDGQTMWVTQRAANGNPARLMAYSLDSVTWGERDTSRDIDLPASVATKPDAIFTDGTTMWVTTAYNRKVYAFDLATGERAPHNDVRTNVEFPRGIFVQGTTMWVVEWEGSAAAYNLLDRSVNFNLHTLTLDTTP